MFNRRINLHLPYLLLCALSVSTYAGDSMTDDEFKALPRERQKSILDQWFEIKYEQYSDSDGHDHFLEAMAKVFLQHKATVFKLEKKPDYILVPKLLRTHEFTLALHSGHAYSNYTVAAYYVIVSRSHVEREDWRSVRRLLLKAGECIGRAESIKDHKLFRDVRMVYDKMNHELLVR